MNTVNNKDCKKTRNKQNSSNNEECETEKMMWTLCISVCQTLKQKRRKTLLLNWTTQIICEMN